VQSNGLRSRLGGLRFMAMHAIFRVRKRLCAARSRQWGVPDAVPKGASDPRISAVK